MRHDEYNSFTYNQSGFRIEAGGLALAKIDRITIVLHRQPINVKQMTVCRQNGRWYEVVTCEFVGKIFRFIDARNSIGIDMGINKFAHDSDNDLTENPLFLTKILKPLARAQEKGVKEGKRIKQS